MIASPPDAGRGSTRLALNADLLDFTDEPAWGETGSPDALPRGVRFRPNHWLLVEDGTIVAVTPEPPDSSAAPGGDWTLIDHRHRLLLPGFIDTHVHMPQIDVIASYGADLLEWLQTWTWPAEVRYADPAVSMEGAERFVDALFASGTTAAVAFPTAHRVSADALFSIAGARGMRLITGKVLQDRHSPDGLRDDVDLAERDCIDLIERWHGNGRLGYAVTVRFAPTSSDAQLAMAGGLCAADASLWMQTHIAESRAEIDWVRELFPAARSYLDVYDRVGLLHAKSLLAHGIWLDDADRHRLHEAGAQIAHCPSSNLFLGSGLFDWPRTAAAGVAVSLASDVGGGTSLSTLRTIQDACKVQALQGNRLTAWTALHAATRGAARALGLADEIGSLEPGAIADVCVWERAVEPVAARRLALAKDLHEELFAWMMLADDRNLVETRVAGVLRHRRT